VVIALCSIYAIPKVSKAFSFRDLLPNFSVKTEAQTKDVVVSKVDKVTKDSAVNESRSYTDSRFNYFDSRINTLNSSFKGLENQVNNLGDISDTENNNTLDSRSLVENPMTENLDGGQKWITNIRRLHIESSEDSNVNFPGIQVSMNSHNDNAITAETHGNNSYAGYFNATGNNSYAGNFEGDVKIDGDFNINRTYTGYEGDSIFSVYDGDIVTAGPNVDINGADLTLNDGNLHFNNIGFPAIRLDDNVSQFDIRWDGSSSYYTFSREGLVIADGSLDVYGDIRSRPGNKIKSSNFCDGSGNNCFNIATSTSNIGTWNLGSNLNFHEADLVFSSNYGSGSTAHIKLEDDVENLRIGWWEFNDNNNDYARYNFGQDLFRIYEGDLSLYQGSIGIGTDSPNRNLHIKTNEGDQYMNAEIDIQSGDNNYWGIYQDHNDGSLNFWHEDNRVIFTNEGIETDKIDLGELCLDDICVDSWGKLKLILSNMTY